MEEKTTSNSGKFTFKATRDVFQLSPKDDKYIIKISKPGHVTLKHAVSTKVPADKKPSWPTYVIDVELFKMPIDKVKQEKTLMSILKKPISIFAYNAKKGDFKDDRAYFSTIQARVEQLFEILDANERGQYRLVAAYRLRMLEEEKRREAEAESKARAGEVKLAGEAAKRAEKENLAREAEERKAKDKKHQAAIAKADEKYPKDRIKEINDALAAKTTEREVLAKAKEGGKPEEEAMAKMKKLKCSAHLKKQKKREKPRRKKTRR